MRLLYSFVLDEDARFIREGEIFLRTLISAGVSPDAIVAQVTERSGPVGKKLAARFGVRALDLPLGPDSRYTNKINQLFTLERDDFDVLIACDTDLAIIEPLDPVASMHTVRARRVDQDNPPLRVLEHIQSFLGVHGRPSFTSPGCQPAATTYALNCNGGLLMIPRQFMQTLANQWLRYAQILHGNRELLERWVDHIDQVSWAFAMMNLQLPFHELPIEYNFPTSLAKRIPRRTYRSPIVLHYHRDIDRKGKIKSSRVWAVNRSIKKANKWLEPRNTAFGRLLHRTFPWVAGKFKVRANSAPDADENRTHS